MNRYCRRLQAAFYLFALCVLPPALTLPSPAGAQVNVPAAAPSSTRASAAVPATPPAPSRTAAPPKTVADRFVTIDFNNVDITVFIKFISELTGKNFVVDNRVRGNVTIISPAKISLQEAYKVFESVLDVHGFAAVPAGEVTKIIPAPDARTKSIETKLREEAASPDDKIITQLIPLTYADPEEIKRLFAPLISKNSVILSYPPTNMLIVTDVYSNIQRLIHILKAIDITGIGREISVIPLEYADAVKLEKTLASVLKTPPTPRQKGAPETTTIQLVADERTNTLVLLASEDETLRIKQLIRLLDKEIPRGKENIRVVYLEHATAEDLVKVLQEIPKKKDAPAQGKPESPVISDKVKMTADKATNSLIIMAEKDDFVIIEEVIKKLDIPRSMVYIESLIMEVNATSDLSLGTEWAAGGEVSYDGRPGVVGGGFKNPESLNLTGISQGILPGGFTLGTFAEVITIGGVTFPSIAAVIQAYQKDENVHILSTPQILTTDNQEAKITVGKNVPYQTKSAAESSVETYSSYEYRDVGITLKITPQISKDRMVRLIISQEVTKLTGGLAQQTTDRPTTLKRTIDTTVIVKDGHTIVIGGLIDDSITETETKVPCLGDIPLMGWLFKSISNASERTNLYVFLTPRVINNPAEAEAIYQNKKNQIDTVEEGNIKLYDKNKTDASPGAPVKPAEPSEENPEK